MCDRSERLAEEFRPGDDKSQKVNSEISVIWDKLYVTVSTVGEKCRAFVPTALPPDPPLLLNDEDHDLLEKANRPWGVWMV